MAAPLVPSPLDCIGRRRFAFYPAIAHLAPNSWILGTGSQSEVQVVNTETGCELWIARQHIGGVTESAHGQLIVGLTKALEHHTGNVAPRIRQVIEMPVGRVTALNPGDGVNSSRVRSASVVGIRLESRTESPWNKALAAAFIAALVFALLAALVAGTFRL